VLWIINAVRHPVDNNFHKPLINADKRRYLGHREIGAASGFALGRNQKVRLVEKLRNMLQI